MTPPDDTYTHGHADAVLRSHRWRTVENSAAYLLPHLTPSMRVLDVGCGPGTISTELATIVNDGHVVGVDRAESVIAEAHQHAMFAGVSNIDFVAGDIYRLGFDDNVFDVVHAHQVLQHLSDPVAALREMRRVCKPGGVVAARDADYAAMTWFPESPALDRWLTIYHDVARGNAAEPDAGRHLRSWALQAGFVDVACTATAWCFASTEDRWWWTDLWADRLTTTDFGRQAVAAGLSSPAELASLATAWREWGTNDDGWFAILHGEILATA